MQFNLVNDQEQVAQFVWRGVVLSCMALALGSIGILGVCLQRLLACACIICMWRFAVASSGCSSGQRLLCILYVRLRMSSWFCLAQRLVCWGSCVFKYFPSLLSLLRGVGAPP